MFSANSSESATRVKLWSMIDENVADIPISDIVDFVFSRTEEDASTYNRKCCLLNLP